MNIREISSSVGIAIVSVIVTLIAVNGLKGKTESREKNDIAIEYEVSEDAGKLVITAPDTDNCKGGVKTGCFRIKKSKTGLIKFVFNDNDDQWALNQITICRGDTKIVDVCGSTLTLDEQLEFFVLDDDQGTTILLTPASGEVSLAPLPAGTKTFYLLDQNTIKQTYFYNIEVCRKDAPEICLTLDPPIENKGLN